MWPYRLSFGSSTKVGLSGRNHNCSSSIYYRCFLKRLEIDAHMHANCTTALHANHLRSIHDLKMPRPNSRFRRGDSSCCNRDRSYCKSILRKRTHSMYRHVHNIIKPEVRGAEGAGQDTCSGAGVVQGWCRGYRGGAGGAGRGAGYLHRLHLSKHNIWCREVQGVQAHLNIKH